MRFDVARVDRAGLVALDAQHRLVRVGREHERELFEALDDLVHVLDDTRNGLVLVDHAVQAERPHGGPTQRGQEHAAQRVPQRVPVTAFQRLESKLGRIRVVLALGHFHQVRMDQPRQIKSRDHLE